jgi:hypothetical protein
MNGKSSSFTSPTLTKAMLFSGRANVIALTLFYAGLALCPPKLSAQSGAPPGLQSIVSRKTHAGAGNFDMPLYNPAAACAQLYCGSPQVECRTGGPNGNFTLIFTFDTQISSCGTATNGAVEKGPGPDQCTLNLSGVLNATYVSAGLNGVVSLSGGTTDVPPITMGVLFGDVDGSKRTDAGDVTNVRNHTVSVPDQTTFRNDVNCSGRIDAGDVTATRNATVTALP